MQVVVYACKHDRYRIHLGLPLNPYGHGQGLHQVQICSASIIKSGQNSDFNVFMFSLLAIILILAFLTSALSYAEKMTSSNLSFECP